MNIIGAFDPEAMPGNNQALNPEGLVRREFPQGDVRSVQFDPNGSDVLRTTLGLAADERFVVDNDGTPRGQSFEGSVVTDSDPVKVQRFLVRTELPNATLSRVVQGIGGLLGKKWELPGRVNARPI